MRIAQLTVDESEVTCIDLIHIQNNQKARGKYNYDSHHRLQFRLV